MTLVSMDVPLPRCTLFVCVCVFLCDVGAFMKPCLSSDSLLSTTNCGSSCEKEIRDVKKDQKSEGRGINHRTERVCKRKRRKALFQQLLVELYNCS